MPTTRESLLQRMKKSQDRLAAFETIPYEGRSKAVQKKIDDLRKDIDADRVALSIKR